MKSLLFSFLLLSLSANTNVVRAAEDVSVEVTPSETQPLPELPFDRAYTPFTSFEVRFPENNQFGVVFIRRIALSVSFFDSNGLPCDDPLKVEDYLSSIIAVADPSDGNSNVIEKKIIAYKKVTKTNNGKITLFTNQYCSNGAKFTVLGIPKGAKNFDIKVGINVLALKYSQLPDSAMDKAEGLPFDISVGTKQPIGTYGEAPDVKVSWTLPSSSGRSLIVEVSGEDVKLDKIFIKSRAESAILGVIPDTQQTDYVCQSDGSILSTDFNGGIEIGGGGRLFVYCKNDNGLLRPKSVMVRNMIFYDAISGRLLAPSKP